MFPRRRLLGGADRTSVPRTVVGQVQRDQRQGTRAKPRAHRSTRTPNHASRTLLRRATSQPAHPNSAALTLTLLLEPGRVDSLSLPVQTARGGPPDSRGAGLYHDELPVVRRDGSLPVLLPLDLRTRLSVF